MDVLTAFVERIKSRLFSDFDVYQLIRLVMIIGGYYFLRTRVSEYLKQKQITDQLKHDKEMKEQKLIDDPTGEVAEAEAGEMFQESEGINRSEKGWGWGKSTRRKVRKQQALFEKEIERAAVEAQQKLESGYNSDDEINQFLQD